MPCRSRASLGSETTEAQPRAGTAVVTKAHVPDVQTQLLHRHSAGGNQMVLRLLESSRSGTTPPGDDLAEQLRAQPGTEFDEHVAVRSVRAKLDITQPSDPCEQEADAVASRVVGRVTPRTPPALTGPPVTRLTRQAGVPARQAGAIARQAGTPAKTGPADSDAPQGLGAVETVLANSSGGQAMDTAVRERIEPHHGIDLSGARVRQDAGTDAAAKALGARAFTTGSTIFLAAGESPTDLGLMAHEATHVAQQTGTAAVHPMIMRDVSVTDVIPDFILDGVRDAVTAIPGYTLLTLIIGTDPLTDRPVQVQREELVEKLLTHGPFGAAVAQVLKSIDVIGDVFALICDGFAAHNLTLTRIGNDIDAAWEELSVTNGIDGNVAIVRRYVEAILNDVGAFVRSIVERVIEIVRSVVAEVAEPFLQRPEVKPVWDLARKVLHYDPLRGEDVDAPTVEILADFLRLIGQEQRLAQMTERGTLQQAADWLDTQFATFAGIVGDLGALFSDAWQAINPQNLPNLLDTLPPLADRAIALVRRIANFATTVIGKVLELVKQSLLGWLSEHAHQIPGFHLLTVILGRNPFTGDAVPRTAENLIKGFITLMPNGEATYAQLAETGVIGEAAARIESEMARLGISWELITNTFLGIWNTLTLDDLLAPLAAFERILAQFREPIERIVEFVTVVVEAVITLVLKLMNFPSDLLASIINNAKRAIDDIERDPIAFLINMLAALKGGFLAFFDNIATFLLQGLTAWLFRGLNAIGITAPPDLSLGSILNLVLQVLGVTIDNLWQKLTRHLGPDRVAMIRGAIDKLTGAWAFIREVQEQGISAVWHYVVDKLGNLWDTLLGMARDWIMGEIIERVIAKLVSMLDPTGVMAVVNSFIAFFNAIQSAIEYLRDILQIVNEYVTTFAQVAAGNIGPGAEKIKEGLGHAIPIAIGFLANQVGIGNVPEKVIEIIGGLRELIDQALDWLVEQAVELGQAALSALGIGGTQDGQPTGPETPPPAPGGPERPLTPEERGQLYADVGQAVGERVHSVTTPEDAQRFLSMTLTQFAPRGLKAVYLKPAPDHAAEFEVHAEASPGQKVGSMTAAERISVSDLTSRYSTVLVATLNGEQIGPPHRSRGESEGDHQGHAETWLLTYLTGGVMSMATRGELNELDVRITRSPCPECQGRILRRLTTLREELGFDIHMTIRTSSVHRGHTVAGVQAFVDIAMLDERRITLAAWDIMSELDQLGIPQEEQEELRADTEAVRRLEQRVQQVRRILEAIGDLRVATASAR